MDRPQRVSHPPSRSRGVVLLSILLILALLSALGYQMVGRHGLTVAQVRHTFMHDQALAYALGAEAFARQVLYEDWSDTGPGSDNLQEAWAQPLVPFEIEDGLLEVQIRDLNGCFNLNSLAGAQTEDNLNRLKTLLRNAGVPDAMADTWRDWVDADEEVSGFGAEDASYLLDDTAYRTANRMAGHISELMLLKDASLDFVEALRGSACLLPSDELRLNVNTASADALAALSPDLAPAQMESFVMSERSYEEVGEVTEEFPELAGSAGVLSVVSEYFEVQVRAEVGETRAELASIVHRDPNDGSMTLIARDFGRDFRSRFEEEEG